MFQRRQLLQCFSQFYYNSSNWFVTESFEERQLDKRKVIEKESLFTRHLGVDNSHVSLATDKDSKLQQLKALAYKSNLAKASSAQTKPNIGIVKLKRKHQKKPADLQNNSIGEGASDLPSNTVSKVAPALSNIHQTVDTLSDDATVIAQTTTTNNINVPKKASVCSVRTGSDSLNADKVTGGGGLSSLCNYSDASSSDAD